MLFSPDDGGTLIATDGRRLAGAPARFTGRSFILPTPAVHVLGHPDFATRDATVRQADDPKTRHVEFRSGPHTLIAREIEGNYPNYRQVIPSEFRAEATIAETQRPALIAWLRSLTGRRLSVRLNWERPGTLTLTCVDNDAKAVTIQVPVTVSGTPPVIAFEPGYLASAFEIGPVLRLIDGMSPGVTVGPGGVFCVLMPMRCDPAVIGSQAGDQEDRQGDPDAVAVAA